MVGQPSLSRDYKFNIALQLISDIFLGMILSPTRLQLRFAQR